MKIHIWPDDSWCEPSELEEFLMHSSDDFETIEVPDAVTDTDDFISGYRAGQASLLPKPPIRN